MNMDYLSRFKKINNFVFDDSPILDANGEVIDRKHEYSYLDEKGNKIICKSATGILAFHGLAPDFNAGPQLVLLAAKKAGEKGTSIHQMVEDYFKKGSDVRANFEAHYAVTMIENLLKAHGIDPKKVQLEKEIFSEKSMVVEYTNNNTILPLAGTADFVFKTPRNTLFLCDLKTGDRHPEAEVWQMSIYKTMLKVWTGLDVENCCIIHSHDTKSKTVHQAVDITKSLVSLEKVCDLLDCQMKGISYKQEMLTDKEISEIFENHRQAEQNLLDFITQNNYFELVKQKEDLEKELSKCTKTIETIMRTRGLKTLENSTGYSLKLSETSKNILDVNSFMTQISDEQKQRFTEFMFSGFDGLTEKEKSRLKEECNDIYQIYEKSCITLDAVKTTAAIKSPNDDLIAGKKPKKSKDDEPML